MIADFFFDGEQYSEFKLGKWFVFDQDVQKLLNEWRNHPKFTEWKMTYELHVCQINPKHPVPYFRVLSLVRAPMADLFVGVHIKNEGPICKF